MQEFPGPRMQRELRPYMHKYVRIRLAIYLIIAISVGAFVIYNAFRNEVPGVYAAIGFGIGLVIGFLFTRIHRTRWDDKAEKVILRMDILGVFLLALYWTFELSREKIVGHFLSGAEVTVTSFSILAGIMYGRVIGIRGNVLKVLREKDIL